MKKIYVLVFLVALILQHNVSAQTKTTSPRTAENASNENNIEELENTEKYTLAHNMSARKNDFGAKCQVISKIKAETNALNVFYDRPIGTYFFGMIIENNTYGWNPTIVAPALKNIEFTPSNKEAGVTYKWTAMDGTVSLESETDPVTRNYIINNIPNLYAIAELTGTRGDESTTYRYGAVDKKDRTYSTSYISLSAHRDLRPISVFDKYMDNFYSGYSTGYWFGPGSTFGGYDQTAVITCFPKPLSTLYVETADMWVSPFVGTMLPDIIPEGKYVTMNIYPVDAEGVVDKSNLLGQATAEVNDITRISNTENDGWLHFVFGGLDDDGFFASKPLLLNDAFAVEVTGYDNTYKFKIVFGQEENLRNAISQAVYGDTYQSFGGSIAMQLNGIYTCFDFLQGENKLVVDNAGGYGVYYDANIQDKSSVSLLYSSFPKEEIEVEVPSWLSVEIDEADFYTNSSLIVLVSGEALPEGVTYRDATIVLNAKGVINTIFVQQGEGSGAGTSFPKASDVRVEKTAGSFEIKSMGDYTSVGLFNIAGQAVNRYDVRKNSTLSIPTSNLSSGVYLLRFEGNGLKETVKVIK